MQLHLLYNGLSRKSIKNFLIGKRPEIRRSNPNGTSSLLYRFNEAIISLFDRKQDQIDLRTDTIRSVALRAIRFAGDSPDQNAILQSLKDDSACEGLMASKSISEAEVMLYIRENRENLVNDDYLTRGGRYQPPVIQL